MEHKPTLVTAARRGAGKPAVLIVEDQPVSRRLLEVWLNKLGFLIDSAVDGDEALRRLTADDGPAYRLVLMDCCLPGINGVDVTRRLRAWEAAEARRPVPIIGVSSADAEEFSRRNCLAAGMDEFVPKPLHLPELGVVILGLLDD